MSDELNSTRQVLLAKRPRGRGIAPGDLEIAETTCLEPDEGQVRVRVIYISIDPAIRLWMNEKPPVIQPVPLGHVVPSMGVGVVETSRDSSLPVGTLVHGFLGWQTRVTCKASDVSMLPPAPSLPLTAHLSLLGPIGLTAYFGLVDLARPRPQETLVVSGAAGAVGSLAAQIGKIQGCRVIGIAGGPEKCRYLVDELGLDGAIEDSVDRLRRLTGLTITTQLDAPTDTLDDQQRTVVLRVTQEALQNVRKHAEASMVVVSTALDDDDWSLEVRDDGRGFEVEAVAARSRRNFGLQFMHERAALIDARFDVRSRPDGGTVVRLAIPRGAQAGAKENG